MGGVLEANAESPAADMQSRNITARIFIPQPARYTINKLWLALNLFSVAIMLLAAISSFCFRLRCRAPPILGFVSSLTRDSPYFQELLAGTNSTEDGPDKVKRLGKMRVMIADVGMDKRKIAFAPAGSGKSVEKGKRYE